MQVRLGWMRLQVDEVEVLDGVGGCFGGVCGGMRCGLD